MTGQLVLSLFERASRFRLQVLLPNLINDLPFHIQPTQQFVGSMEAVQDWAILTKEANKRFGTPDTMSETSVYIKKIIADRKGKTPFMKKLLDSQHRIYVQSKILPDKISKIFDSDQTIIDAIKGCYLAFNQLDEKYISVEDPNRSRRVHNGANYFLLIKSFPDLNDSARKELGLN